ncbi:hypothetical protein PSQ39_06425 [Curvibacter sp. HBC28]|uniref:HEAT repeat domain-containing protein n=1 Tax=Curvibacter microcysteis TaxID=3026419 RepID=A0ABT5MGP2_9BURK|nr:hypothetical protein [Curvibacter sp. HBC28]MDD0814261.1 hypothetical protein [Curvibacter sp. HBC28]
MATPQDAFKELLSLLDSPTTPLDLRVAAADGLGTIGGEVAREALLKILQSKTQALALRSAAARAIAHAYRQ